MKKSVKNLYEEASENLEFQEDFARQDPEYKLWYKDVSSWSKFTPDQKVIIASIYMGWLLAKNEFDNNKYKQ